MIVDIAQGTRRVGYELVVHFVKLQKELEWYKYHIQQEH